MPVKQREYEGERGRRDAARHRAKQREAIKERIPEIIADTSIITRRKGQTVRIPIRGVKSYHFKHNKKDGLGIGQGKGKEGDIIGRKPPEGQPGKAGNEPGVDYIESEVELEELIQMMFEDLGLPNLEEKDIAEIEVLAGWKLRNIGRTGLRPNIDKKRTLREGMRRLIHFIEELKKLSGASEEECETALELAGGDLKEALRILQDPNSDLQEKKEASPIITKDDLRFKTLEEDIEHYSNAVVLAMMDTSGSMTIMKKYLARSFFFWLTEFLKRLYRNVEIRFIAHQTEAKLVDEETFFHKGESGGTFCYSAYDMARRLVETEYPTHRWNVYCFHFSDGEDWDPEKTTESVKKLLEAGVNMVGYGEIRAEPHNFSNLMLTLGLGLDLKQGKVDELEVFYSQNRETPFLGVIIKGKEDLYPALKEFLRKERW